MTVQRFASNPLLTPRDVVPSGPDLAVECLLNPGAFDFDGRVGLLLRVAERPVQEEGWVATPILDEHGETRIVRIRKDDPDLQMTDPRVFRWRGDAYLTTLSHLRLAWSDDDGKTFVADEKPTLVGHAPLESYGIEDCRVVRIEDRFQLTYTAVSVVGYGVGRISTRDWKSFDRHGLMLCPPNKDCALWPRKIGGEYWCLHRPSGVGLGGNDMWVARSPDLVHWGDHRCVARARPGLWDAGRIGAGAEPIETPAGWLHVYHGADAAHRYALGAMLFDLEEPWRLIARSTEPLMIPSEPYELTGFFNNVVFTNGHVVRGDTLRMYYGASDSVICAADVSIGAILNSVEPCHAEGA